MEFFSPDYGEENTKFKSPKKRKKNTHRLMTKDSQLQKGKHKTTEILKTSKTLKGYKVTKRKMEGRKGRNCLQ